MTMQIKSRMLRLFLYFLLAACIAGWMTELVSAEEDIEDAVTDAVDEDESDAQVEESTKKDEKPKKKEMEHFKAPVIPDGHEDSVYFADSFDSQDSFEKRWIKSSAKKDGVEAAISKYDGQWSVEEPSTKLFIGDYGLVLKSRARHHAISSKFSKAFEFKDKPFVVQYEVKFQQAMECGGAYVKLLSDLDSLDLNNFHDHSQYTIMFGPDKCGEDKKLHFIFQHKHPITGKYSEKHAKKPTGNFQSVFDGKKTHLFTLVLHPDNKYEIFVDQESVSSGNLLEDFTPSVNPEKEIDDPNDKKPEDWDERAKIPDPDAEKPDDWDEDAPAKISDPDAKKPEDWLDDEPELVPDPNSQKPEDWDTEEDGEWEPAQINNPKCEKSGCGEWKAPMINNPNYKGKWTPPLIDNPNYKGIWKPKKIANPDYFEDKEPFKMTSIAAVGLELWSMTPDILFDNFIITDSKFVADKYAEQTWVKKSVIETYGSGDDSSVISGLLEATNDRPWLWVLYVLVVVLPFGLIAACCFPGSKTDSAAQKKKTDEATEDSGEAEEDQPKEETKEEDAAASDEQAKEEEKADEKADEKAEDGDEGQEENLGKRLRRRPRKE